MYTGVTTVKSKLRSTKPLFRQISDALKREIESGALAAGMLVSSENELADTWGVSRMTARAALNDLTRQNFIERRPGIGTFVIGRELRVARRSVAHGLLSFSEEMQSRGLQPSSRVLERGVRVADLWLATQLGISPGSRVVVLKRVRLADNEPMAIEEVHLPYDRFGGVIQTEFSNASLYEVLERDYGARPTRSEETVDAVALDAASAQALSVPPGTPALRARRVTRDASGLPISVGQTLYRVDRFCMVFARER